MISESLLHDTIRYAVFGERLRPHDSSIGVTVHGIIKSNSEYLCRGNNLGYCDNKFLLIGSESFSIESEEIIFFKLVFMLTILLRRCGASVFDKLCRI